MVENFGFLKPALIESCANRIVLGFTLFGAHGPDPKTKYDGSDVVGKIGFGACGYSTGS